jgi:hypothetical protein
MKPKVCKPIVNMWRSSTFDFAESVEKLINQLMNAVNASMISSQVLPPKIRLLMVFNRPTPIVKCFVDSTWIGGRTTSSSKLPISLLAVHLTFAVCTIVWMYNCCPLSLNDVPSLDLAPSTIGVLARLRLLTYIEGDADATAAAAAMGAAAGPSPGIAFGSGT